MADPYAEAMVPISTTGLISFHNCKDVDHGLCQLSVVTVHEQILKQNFCIFTAT